MGRAPVTARARRGYAATLAVGAAGGGLVLLAMHQPWATVAATAPGPLPVPPVQVTGQDLIPLAGALAAAGLAALAAVIATHGPARRVVGGMLVAFGLIVAVSLSLPVSPAAVRSDAAAVGAGQSGGSTTAGVPQGLAAGTLPVGGAVGTQASGRVTMTGPLWRPLAFSGAALIAAAGLAVAWRGSRWPGMSSRYSRTVPAGGGTGPAPAAGADAGQAAAGRAGGSASMWESLSRGMDPTEAGETVQTAPDGR